MKMSMNTHKTILIEPWIGFWKLKREDSLINAYAEKESK